MILGLRVSTETWLGLGCCACSPWTVELGRLRRSLSITDALTQGGPMEWEGGPMLRNLASLSEAIVMGPPFLAPGFWGPHKKRAFMGTPNREHQEYSRNLIEICLPWSLYS